MDLYPEMASEWPPPPLPLPAEPLVEPGACVYGGHPIPAGTPFVSILYSSMDRLIDHAVTPGHCTLVLAACMDHAPDLMTVVRALIAAGMPV